MTGADFLQGAPPLPAPPIRLSGAQAPGTKASSSARPFLVGLLACLPFSFSIGRPVTADRTVVTGQGKGLDDYLRRLSGFGFSGCVLVSRNGTVLLRKGYGLAEDGTNVPLRPETLFDIGSLSKNFTAAAILRLESDGKLRVGDPISRFLPDLPEDKRAISIHQLLTHTSGVTGPDAGYRAISKAQAIQEILARPLGTRPGTAWAYSNAGYVLLAAIIESASGETYEDYLQGHIFQRAGLKSTGFWGRRLPGAIPRSIAKGKDELGVVTDLERLSEATWNDMGSGQIVSTGTDRPPRKIPQLDP